MAFHERDPDCDVWNLVCKGDNKAVLRLLMQRYGDDVYQVCRRILKDATLAEDVRQQVFLSAYQDLPRFERRSRFRTWLLGIAYHRALDALKSRRRRELREVGLAEYADVHDPSPSALESIDDMRLRTVLNGILGNLREPARVAVVLRFHQEHTFEEMAAICDEDAAVLRNRVSRALRQLRSEVTARTEGAADARRADAGASHGRGAEVESKLTATAMQHAAASLARHAPVAA
jgi:RNA polymerase sigma-70 factor, ECF subfamily